MKRNQHPGQLIKATMKSAKVSQKALAAAISMAPSTLCEVLAGKRGITASFCLALESKGIGDAETWLFMTARHELAKLRAAAA